MSPGGNAVALGFRLDAIGQRLRRRSEVGARRRAGVIALPRRRWAAPEIVGARELLADQAGADDHAIAHDGRAVRPGCLNAAWPMPVMASG